MATATETRSTHYLGLRLNGRLCRFSGAMCDSEFEHLTKDGLPPGWVAWHIDASENRDNSPKVVAIADLPLVVLFAGGLASMDVPKGRATIVSPYPMASAREWIARAFQQAEGGVA